MAKPRPILDDLPLHIKENIAKGLEWKDRCSLRKCSTTLKAAVDRNETVHFDRLGFISKPDSFKIIIKQSEEVVCVEYKQSGLVVVVKTTTMVRGEIVKTSKVVMKNEEMVLVVAAELRMILQKPKLTINVFSILIRKSSSTDEMITGLLLELPRPLEVNRLGLFLNPIDPPNFTFLTAALNLEVLQTVNLHKLSMKRFGARIEAICKSNSMAELDVDVYTGLGTREGRQSTVFSNPRTDKSNVDFWSHVFRSRILFDNDAEDVQFFLDRMWDEFRSRGQNNERFRRSKFTMGRFEANGHFQLQIGRPQPVVPYP